MSATSNVTTTETQISDGNPAGTVIGQSASDLVAFHGATPVDQAAAITSLSASAATSTIANTVNELIVAMREKGLIAT